MGNRTLVFMKTHVITEAVIDEYLKLSKCGYDSFLFIDNSKNILKKKKGTYQREILFGHAINCFLYTQDCLDELHLPIFPSLENIMWYNCDYPLYIMKHYFPNYDYYWQFEFDVFFNGKNYKPFFKKYAKKQEDLIITNFGNPVKNWCWLKNTDWAYGNTKKYMSFFPVERVSARALDILYKERIRYGEIYKNFNQIENEWLHCELFTATEVMRHHLTATSLKEKIGLENIILNKDRIFVHPDNKLYHPVKTEVKPKVDLKYVNHHSDKSILRYSILSMLTWGKFKIHYKEKLHRFILENTNILYH